MRYALAPSNRRVLRRFAGMRVLLAFDFDGTLAPIVRDPKRAAMRDATRALLRKVAMRFPCVVISGRARADAIRKMRGVPTLEVMGNHGIEPWQTSRRDARTVRQWRTKMQTRLAGLAGVRIEDKEFSLSIHYRESPEKAKARLAVRRAASDLAGARVVTGKDVVNLLPGDAPTKGIALVEARRRFGCDGAIYVGDDDTDEDVFVLAPSPHLLTIRVGRNSDSLASYFVRNQAEIDRLLRALLDLRQAVRTTSPRSPSTATPGRTPEQVSRRAPGPGYSTPSGHHPTAGRTG